MSTIRGPGNNPAGLSTFDPMRHEGYRRTAREVSDRFRRVKGLPPLPRTEDAEPASAIVIEPGPREMSLG